MIYYKINRQNPIGERSYLSTSYLIYFPGKLDVDELWNTEEEKEKQEKEIQNEKKTFKHISKQLHNQVYKYNKHLKKS